MTLRTASPAVFAIAAMTIDLVIDAVPWSGGASYLSFAFLEDFPIHAKLSNAVALLVGPIVIAVGIVLLRRGRPSVASGVFIAAGSASRARREERPPSRYAAATAAAWPSAAGRSSATSRT